MWFELHKPENGSTSIRSLNLLQDDEIQNCSRYMYNIVSTMYLYYQHFERLCAQHCRRRTTRDTSNTRTNNMHTIVMRRARRAQQEVFYIFTIASDRNAIQNTKYNKIQQLVLLNTTRVRTVDLLRNSSSSAFLLCCLYLS